VDKELAWATGREPGAEFVCVEGLFGSDSLSEGDQGFVVKDGVEVGNVEIGVGEI